jgi:TolB protein
LKDLKSKKVKRLTQNKVYDGVATFSPDNEKILFVSDQYGGICVMGLDTKKVKSLYQWEEKLLPKISPPLPFYPSFSSDGKKILFDAGFAKRKIYMMDADGENLKCLSGLENEDFFPSFSPDVKRIAFISNRDGADELYLMNSDGAQERRLTFDGMDKKYPCFSPDGKTIAYVAKPEEQKDQYFEIYFLSLNQIILKNELIKRIENLLEMFS